MEQQTTREKLPIGTIVKALDEVRYSNHDAPDTVVPAGTYGRIYENDFQGEAHFEYGVHWLPVSGLVGIEVNRHEFELVPVPRLQKRSANTPPLGALLRAKRTLIGGPRAIPGGTYGVLVEYGCDDGYPYMVNWLLPEDPVVYGTYDECFEVV